jgi:hypothetical protein
MERIQALLTALGVTALCLTTDLVHTFDNPPVNYFQGHIREGLSNTVYDLTGKEVIFVFKAASLGLVDFGSNPCAVKTPSYTQK